MFDFFRINKRLNNIEDTFMDLAGEISTIKAQMARIHAKLAVDSRTKPNQEQTYKKLLEEFMGGQILGVQDGNQPSSNQEHSL